MPPVDTEKRVTLFPLYFLSVLVLLVGLTFRGYASVQVSPVQKAPPVSTLPDTHASQADINNLYYEGAAGTWVMPAQGHGLLFENQYLGRKLFWVTTFGALAALTGKLPHLTDHTGALPRLLANAPALGVPLLVLWHSWQQLGGGHSSTDAHNIVVADDPNLARRFSIRLEQTGYTQKLIFRLTPPALTGAFPHTPETASPLSRLAYKMKAMGSDQLALTWFNNTLTSTVNLSLSQSHSSQSMVNEVRITGWEDYLEELAKHQKLPAILDLLQPAGLNSLLTLMGCIQRSGEAAHREGTYKKGVAETEQQTCNSGSLIPQAEYIGLRQFQFQADKSLSQLRPLAGKIMSGRFLLGIPPCQSKAQCSMAMSWSMASLEGRYVPDQLPGNQTPLHLYTQSRVFNDIPRILPAPVPPLIANVQSWQTDLLSLAPYFASYLLANKLLDKTFGAFGLAQVPVAGSGAGILGWLGIQDLNKNIWGTQHSYSPGGSYFVGKDHQQSHSSYMRLSPAIQDKYRISPQVAAARRLEQALVKATGQEIIKTDLFIEEQTKEFTLPHKGCNCFFDAVMVHIAHSLSETELQAIANDEFEVMPGLTASQQNLYIAFRDSLLELLQTLKNNHSRKVSTRRLSRLQERTFRTMRAYGHVKTSLTQTLQASNLRHLKQQDAEELLNGIYDVLGMVKNQAATTLDGYLETVMADGQTGYNTHLDKANSMHHLPVNLPSLEDIQQHQVDSMDKLLRQGYMKKHLVAGQNAPYFSNSDLRKIGVSATSGHYPTQRRQVIAHNNASKLQHLSLHAKIYDFHRQIKVSGLTRVLLSNSSRLNIPVYNNTLTSATTIAMELDSVVMHQGEGTLYSGHYITAVFRDGYWYIHDDQKARVIQLKPASNARLWNPPISLLTSYMESRGLDPYILHYRR